MIDANTFSANAGKTLCQRTDISKRLRATHATPTESGVKKNSGDWISSLMRSMLLSNTIRAYRVCPFKVSQANEDKVIQNMEAA